MKIFRLLYSITTILFLSILFACENEESLIGENFLENESHDVFILNDELINISISSKPDFNLSAISQVSLLGSYSDPNPNFGKTDASFCFQITLPNNDITFNATEITKIELVLPYNDFYGNPNTSFMVSISKLKNSIASTDEIEHLSSEGDSFETDSIAPKQLVDISTVQIDNTLNISLPLDFGLNEILNLPPEQLENNNNFVEAFPGFKLEVDPVANDINNLGNGGILYLDTGDDNALLNIEYIASTGETESVNFPIAPGLKLNHFAHDYSNSNLFSETPPDTLLFIQSMGGVFGELDFSFLDNLKDSGYIVNSAMLNLPVITIEDDDFTELQLNLCDSDDCNMVDYFPLGQASITSENKYEFNITGYIQDILTNNRNPVCRLYTYQRNSNANRVVLSNSETNPIKLKLILIKG